MQQQWHVHIKNLLGNLGNTGYKGRGYAPHRVRTQDLVKDARALSIQPAIARELAKDARDLSITWRGAKERVLAGSRVRVLQGNPDGPRALAHASGVRVYESYKVRYLCAYSTYHT